jgi:raffinose/stachyose/melibiose transport system substrate-binding protein
MGKHWRILMVIALVASALAACGPTAAPAEPTQPPAATKAPEPTQQVEQPPAAAEATLVVWDVWTRDEESKVIEMLDAEFEAAHPGVTVDRIAKSFDDIKATSKLAMTSPGGPDVIQINQGWSDMGAMVEGGLLLDLSPYAQKYGWVSVISGGIAARNSFSPDGKVFGEGNLYGVPPVAELVGVYYRKDLFEDLGAEVPATFAEFEAILAQAKQAGYVPLTFGNLDAWPAIHPYSEILYTQIKDRTYLDDLIYAWGRGASWDTSENLYAANKLLEWVQAGYFTPGFEGIGYEDSGALFENGQGVMMLTGSWMSSTFQAGPNGDNIGFFLVPPAEAGAFQMSTGGTSLAYAVRATTQHADLAAEYINYLMSGQAASLWAESGTVPVAAVDPSALQEGTLFADLVMAWSSMNQNDAVGHYLDWATPTFYDTISGGLQELMSGQITPQQFTAKLEADHAAFLQQRGR